MYNSSTPGRARDLNSRSDGKPNATISEKSRTRSGVNTKIEVQISSVPVGPSQPVLGTERVPLSRAEIGDLHDNTVTSIRQRVATAVGLRCQLPAGTTGWAGACTWADSKFVLRDCCTVAGLFGQSDMRKKISRYVHAELTYV